MNGKSHQILALTCSIAAGKVLSMNLFSLDGMEYIFSSVVSSKLPDYDLKLGMKHRGITHYGLTPIVISGFTFLLTHSLPISAGIFTGLVSHLIGDMNTVYGVPLLAPFHKKRFRFPWAYRMPKERGKTHPIEIIIVAGCLFYICVSMVGLIA